MTDYIREGGDEHHLVQVVNRHERLLRDYYSGDGSPSGVITPTEIGEWYLDTTAKAWYRSTGTTSTDWQAL